MVNKRRGGLCWHIDGMCLNRPWMDIPLTALRTVTQPFSRLERSNCDSCTPAAQNLLVLVRLLRRTRKKAQDVQIRPPSPRGEQPPCHVIHRLSKMSPTRFVVRPRLRLQTELKKITGHFTYECKDTRPYVSRPSRTAQLENPQLILAAAKSKADVDPSSVPDEFKNKFVFFFSVRRGVCFLTHRWC